jgi:hypothetical protein
VVGSSTCKAESSRYALVRHSNTLGNSVQYLQHITFGEEVVPSSIFFQDAYYGNHREFNMLVSNNYSKNRILCF